MILKSFTSFLALLVLLTPAGDIAAAATPDLDDDILAAQDKDCLLAARPERPRFAPAEETPFSFGLSVPTNGPSASSPTLARVLSAGLIADQLYSFMSLQC